MGQPHGAGGALGDLGLEVRAEESDGTGATLKGGGPCFCVWKAQPVAWEGWGGGGVTEAGRSLVQGPHGAELGWQRRGRGRQDGWEERSRDRPDATKAGGCGDGGRGRQAKGV